MGILEPLARLHDELGWPDPQTVVRPTGGGPSEYVRLAQQKIGVALLPMAGAGGVEVGALFSNPAADDTDVPIAVVCVFGGIPPAEAVHEAHRLAWNFCRAPLLIVLDPAEIRAWSCFEPPQRTASGAIDASDAEIPDVRGVLDSSTSLADQAAGQLEWINLASGHFFKTRQDRFLYERRADRTLLENLRQVRRTLAGDLPADVVHDLLARLIFIQFLFQRKDSRGVPALNEAVLARLYREGILRSVHVDLAGLLDNHRDTYALFEWLNGIFNGDLFPGKAKTKVARQAEWQAERRQVTAEHLGLLARFVGGTLEMRHGQYSLWPLYAFDSIPLEFVSSIYEEFVRNPDKKSVHYTPIHLVDFVLDSVLPWTGDAWDLRVLDPSCGSGIFLVRSYQRLIRRWKNAHPEDRISAAVLRRLLERNLTGVDIDEHAVRVASFSLYLAMCDEIDPREYWRQVRFPNLRGRSLLAVDFFEDVDGISTARDSSAYDIVVGNAPWGTNTLTPPAEAWATTYDWPQAYRDIGTVFLGKALHLVRENGHVAMLQSAGTLLLNRGRTTERVRRHLFEHARVEEIVNFSVLRHDLFPTAVSPACSVTLRKAEHGEAPVTYMCPKRVLTGEDGYRIRIDVYDVHCVTHQEAIKDPLIWSVLLGGSRRHVELVRRLRDGRTSLGALRDEGVLEGGEGIILGSLDHTDLRDRAVLLSKDFPEGTGLTLDPSRLPRHQKVSVYPRARTRPSIFNVPQLIVKQTMVRTPGGAGARVRAVLVPSTRSGPGVVCSQSYLTFHMAPEHATVLRAACLALNSSLATFYLALTGGRTTYRQEGLATAVYDFPLAVDEVPVGSDWPSDDAALDALVMDAYRLDTNDQLLVRDTLRYTIPELIRQPGAESALPTVAGSDAGEPFLTDYCATLLRALEAGGAELGAVIFTAHRDHAAGVRLVAVYLDTVPDDVERIAVVPAASNRLGTALRIFAESSLSDEDGGVAYQRVARLYATVTVGGGRVPAVFLVKPDERRYWTGSVALRDADMIAADALAGAYSHRTGASGSLHAR